jgi:aspartyl-tRNA synthetase
MGLLNDKEYKLLWVVDFPMFEEDEEDGGLKAMHHPFTCPKLDQLDLLDTDPLKVKADAYDIVLNGVELGGGSVRIHDKNLQAKMFEILGFTPEKAQQQFGFLMNAFKYGAPPHGGLAYGLDRWVSLFAGLDSIRDCIAFPKNNSGRDVMLDAPGFIDQAQLDELCLSLNLPQE